MRLLSPEWVRDLRAAILPWGVYGGAFALGQTRLGGLLAAVTLLAVRARCWREMKLPDLAILLFFVEVALPPRVFPVLAHGGLRAASLPALLALFALGSSLCGRPFTLQYARQRVGPEWWRNPHFLRVNHVLTGVWSLSFLMIAVVIVLADGGSPLLRAAAAVVQFALLLAALLFTRAYPRWYRLHRYLPRVRAGMEPYLRAPPRF